MAGINGKTMGNGRAVGNRVYRFPSNAGFNF